MGRCEGSAVRAVSSAKLYLYCELSKRKGRVAGVGTHGECLAGECPYISLHVKWATGLSSVGNREASGRKRNFPTEGRNKTSEEANETSEE